jgi:DNA-binding NarL/FixJ family response regulator
MIDEPTRSCHVLVVDDNEQMCSAYAHTLARLGQRCTVAHSVAEARALLERRRRPRFDAVLLDLYMPGGDGSELLPVLDAEEPAAGVAVVSARLDAERAIDLCCRVRLAVPKPVPQLGRLIELLATRPEELELARVARERRLSPRETEVIRLALRGLGNKEIASELGCAPSTVLMYWKRIYAKVGVRPSKRVLALFARGR